MESAYRCLYFVFSSDFPCPVKADNAFLELKTQTETMQQWLGNIQLGGMDLFNLSTLNLYKTSNSYNENLQENCGHIQ